MELGEITIGPIMSAIFFCLGYSCPSGELLSVRNFYSLYKDELDCGFTCSELGLCAHIERK